VLDDRLRIGLELDARGFELERRRAARPVPDPLVHDAGVPELTHPGIDDG